MSTFTPNYIRSGLKSPEQAYTKCTKMIIENPACAGIDGKLVVMFCGQRLELTPIKKKKKDEEK